MRNVSIIRDFVLSGDTIWTPCIASGNRSASLRACSCSPGRSAPRRAYFCPYLFSLSQFCTVAKSISSIVTQNRAKIPRESANCEFVRAVVAKKRFQVALHNRTLSVQERSLTVSVKKLTQFLDVLLNAGGNLPGQYLNTNSLPINLNTVHGNLRRSWEINFDLYLEPLRLV